VSALLFPRIYGCTNNGFFALAIELRNWKQFLVLVDQKEFLFSDKLKCSNLLSFGFLNPFLLTAIKMGQFPIEFKS